MAAPPEFSRPVPLARLGAGVLRRQIEATPQEREALARRLGLLALDRFEATVELRREACKTILLEAEFSAQFVQECVVSLEPVPDAVSDRFALRYGPARAEDGEIVLAGDEEPLEPLEGDAIDIGEAVAQELSLALPEFPRFADAAVEAGDSAGPGPGPFAALARLKKPE
jgi:uncharacterized metal-binding protein YceD (DUF177 family)